MKKKLVVIGMMICLSLTSYSQVTFSVSKGSLLTSAKVGFKFNKLVPFVGLQYYGVSAKVNTSSQNYDNATSSLVTDTYSEQLKVNLFLTNLGVKYFFLEREKLKAFASIGFTLPLATVKVKDSDLNQEIKEEMRKVRLFGSELSCGVEYFVDDQFSIGGEFGLRFIQFKYSNEESYTVVDQVTGALLDAESSETLSVNLRPSFTKISLNFYF